MVLVAALCIGMVGLRVSVIISSYRGFQIKTAKSYSDLA